MTVLLANNATSRLYAAIDAAATSIRVEAGKGELFPSPTAPDYFPVTIEDRRTSQIEICKAIGRSGDILNVVRGQESTVAQAFALGATVSHRLTAGTLTEMFGGVTTHISETPPVDAAYGNFWYENDTGALYIYYFDGNSAQWVQVAGQGAFDTTNQYLPIADGTSIPTTVVGRASIFVDALDGDLKVKFGDGTIKTIVVDT